LPPQIKSISIEDFKNNCDDLLNKVNESKEPIYITDNEKSKAVIIDLESYEKLLDTADLNKMLAHKSKDIQPINQSDDFVEQSSFFKEFKELTSK